MIVIFVCNFIIIYKVKCEDAKRKRLQIVTGKKSLCLNLNLKAAESKVSINAKFPKLLNSNYEIKLLKKSISRATLYGPNAIESKKPFYLNLDYVINQIKNKANNSKSIIRMLLAMSFAFTLLNLPYVINWLWFYVSKAFFKENLTAQTNLFACLQIFEIFYVLKYATHFYLNYASSSIFREQLKYLSKSYVSINN
jgi:hypothetical protein